MTNVEIVDLDIQPIDPDAPPLPDDDQLEDTTTVLEDLWNISGCDADEE